MPFKAIIFDLDGTLLNTLADIGNAVNRVLAAGGQPTHELDAYRFFVGDGSETLVNRALPDGQRSDAVVQRYLRAFKEEYATAWDKTTQPYLGISQLLDALTERGVKMAVNTNKPHAFSVLCVETMLSGWHFEQILGQGDTFPKKPAPDGALSITKKMQVDPADVIFLGDSGVDMQTAVSAGMYPAGALWGFRTERELVANGCRFLARQPLDVLELLNPE